MSVTYHVVIPIDRIEGWDLVPGEAEEAPNREAAKRRIQAMAGKRAGALAFSRTGDPESGDFQDGEVIAVYGAVDTGGVAGIGLCPAERNGLLGIKTGTLGRRRVSRSFRCPELVASRKSP